MFNHIKVISRVEMERMKQILLLPNVAVISIVDTGKIPVFTVEDCSNHPDRILSLSFDDADARNLDKGEIPMTEEQAKEVVDFLTNLPDSVNHLIVHCTAGICRSGAIGAFARDFFSEIPWEIFKNRENPQISPNAWVSHLLRAELFRRGT